jgi:hypothetical protein
MTNTPDPVLAALSRQAQDRAARAAQARRDADQRPEDADAAAADAARK